MNAVTSNWKTSLAGILAGILVSALTVYKPGMTPESWALALVVALGVSLPGVLAHDGFVPPAKP